MRRAGDRAGRRRMQSRTTPLPVTQLCPRQEDEAENVPLSTNRGDQEQLTTKIATVANCRRVDRGAARETVQGLPQEQQRPPRNLEKLIDC